MHRRRQHCGREVDVEDEAGRGGRRRLAARPVAGWAERSTCERWLTLTVDKASVGIAECASEGEGPAGGATYLAFMFESGSRANGDDPHGGAWTRAWRREVIERKVSRHKDGKGRPLSFTAKKGWSKKEIATCSTVYI